MAGLRMNDRGSVAALAPWGLLWSVQYLIFCACSMQNGPHVFKVDHTGFCVFGKLFTQTFWLAVVTSLSYTPPIQTTPSQNVEKLTCVHGRFKSPFFLWLIQILKAVTMIMVTAITFFWSKMANPAIQVSYTAANPAISHTGINTPLTCLYYRCCIPGTANSWYSTVHFTVLVLVQLQCNTVHCTAY
jgi:hypothetical protein